MRVRGVGPSIFQDRTIPPEPPLAPAPSQRCPWKRPAGTSDHLAAMSVIHMTERGAGPEDI